MTPQKDTMTPLQEIGNIIDRHRGLEGPLLPILHAIQHQLGYIPPESEGQLAAALNLSSAEVRGVISFYHDFKSSPAGQHRVQVCCAEACQARGSRQLADHAVASLGIEFGATSADGKMTLEKVYCLGNCACGPSVRIADEVYANVDSTLFDALAMTLRDGPTGGCEK